MDRTIVYPSAIPQDTDILSPQRDAMIALGWLIQTVLGTSTGVTGLPCNPTSPASLTVNVGPGVIWSNETVDATAFGSLGADTTSPLMKMGINFDGAGTNFTLTAPTSSGQSINYLIEATFQEKDTDAVVLPYVNASNPSQPYSGPSNSGTSQYTLRQQAVELQLKAGSPAATGSQTTPTVDSGWVGLYVITVNYGQTQITSSDIQVFTPSPFLAATLQDLASASGAGTGAPYDIAGGAAGTMTGSQVLLYTPVGRAWTCTACYADLLTAPTSALTLTVTAGGSQVATINFAAGSGSGTITFTSGNSFAVTAGQILKVVAPSTPDTTAAGVSFTLVGATG